MTGDGRRSDAAAATSTQGDVAEPALSCHGLVVSYADHVIMRDVDLEVAQGEVVGIRGKSGSGKSSLLMTLAGLTRPSAGQVSVRGRRIDALSDRERSRIRLRTFGIAFQSGDLIPEICLGENVGLPLRMQGVSPKQARKRALDEMEALGIADLYHRGLSEVSGGQAQRGALARAMVTRPAIILADEPTGALDDETAESAVAALIQRAREYAIATLVVTHHAGVAALCDRVASVSGGTLETV